MWTFASAAAIVASVAYARPAPEILGRDTISLVQVPAGQVFKSGPIEMMKVYQKYAAVGATVPTHVAAAAASAQSGQATASPESYDESYLVPVTVGSQTLTLDFDTGSADLWVFSNELPSSESSGHTTYTVSSSKVQSGETWNIDYGDGSGASGNVYADKVVVGGVTATSQSVEAATSVSSEFVSDTQNDGLLGLAFGSINTCTPNLCTTFFDTVKSTLASKLFTATLKKGKAGYYDFGYIDSTKYNGSITYNAVSTTNGLWQFTAGAYGTGSATPSGSIGSSIADTGTSLIYIPDAAVSNYYASVSGATNSATYGGWVFPCSATLPNWKIVIGGATYTVPGSYLNYAPANSAGTTCFGGIQSSDGIGYNILGDIFLKTVFAVFDQTQSSPRIGFAEQSSS